MSFSKFTTFFAVMFFTATAAHAYIDPGSGSALMSVIIGFFVAIGVAIKTFWYKILSLLGLSKTSQKQKTDKE